MPPSALSPRTYEDSEYARVHRQAQRDSLRTAAAAQHGVHPQDISMSLPPLSAYLTFSGQSDTERGAFLQAATGVTLPAYLLTYLSSDAARDLYLFIRILQSNPQYTALFALLADGRYKLCSKCGEARPNDPSGFYVRDRRLGRLHSECIVCYRARERARHKNRPGAR